MSNWHTDRVWSEDTPPQVLAQFLEDNPEHAHDPETYDHLRSHMDGTLPGIHWAQHPVTGRIAAWPTNLGGVHHQRGTVIGNFATFPGPGGGHAVNGTRHVAVHGSDSTTTDYPSHEEAKAAALAAAWPPHRPLRLARRTAADRREAADAVKKLPQFALHDWLVERPEHLHDPETLAALGDAVDTGARVVAARHPTTGKVAAWHSDAPLHTVESIRKLREDTGRHALGHPHVLFHGPGGVFGVRSFSSYEGSPPQFVAGEYSPHNGELTRNVPLPGPPGFGGRGPNGRRVFAVNEAEAAKVAREAAWTRPPKVQLGRLQAPAGGAVVNNSYQDGGSFLAAPLKRIRTIAPLLKRLRLNSAPA